MQDYIFRKGDIRGIVGKDFLLEDIPAFGRALAAFLGKKNCSKQIILGRDGRSHSLAIQERLVGALTASGFDIHILGVCPTPLVYYAQHKLLYSAAVMITASHNEQEYNGFKICLGKELLDEYQIQELKELYKKREALRSVNRGKVFDWEEKLREAYVEHMVEQFAHLQNNTISAVIDCVGGAAAALMPQLVEQMGWQQVKLLNTTIDGTFAHACPDPTKAGALDTLKREVLQRNAVAGFAFDGDGDRLAAMTHEGKPIVSGDLLLALFAQALLQKNPGATIVFDSKCSQVVSTLIEQWGGTGVMSATGHTFVKQKMAQTGALLAGELSCHFMFKDRYFGCDDAVYALFRMIEILHETGSTLHALVARFPTSYTTGEVRIPCAEAKKEAIVESVRQFFAERADVQLHLMDGVRATTAYGWGIVRASNTQPVISYSCEAMTLEGFEKIKNDFRQALERAYAGDVVYHKKFMELVG